MRETLKARVHGQALPCALPHPRSFSASTGLHQPSPSDLISSRVAQPLYFLVPPLPWQLPPGSFSHPLHAGSHHTSFTPHGPRDTLSLKWRVVMKIKWNKLCGKFVCRKRRHNLAPFPSLRCPTLGQLCSTPWYDLWILSGLCPLHSTRAMPRALLTTHHPTRTHTLHKLLTMCVTKTALLTPLKNFQLLPNAHYWRKTQCFRYAYKVSESSPNPPSNFSLPMTLFSSLVKSLLGRCIVKYRLYPNKGIKQSSTSSNCTILETFIP